MTIEELEEEYTRNTKKPLPEVCEFPPPRPKQTELSFPTSYGDFPAVFLMADEWGKVRYMTLTEDGRVVPVEETY